MPEAISIERIEGDLRRVLEGAQARHEPLIIHQQGREVGVVLPMEDYRALRSQASSHSVATPLPGLVVELLDRLEEALEAYEDLEQRVICLHEFRERLDALWPVSRERTDKFRWLLSTLEDSLHETKRWSHLSREQVRALRTASRYLAEPEVTADLVAHADQVLFQYGLNSMPTSEAHLQALTVSR